MKAALHALLAFGILPNAPLHARTPRIPEAASPAEATPGKIALLTAPEGMRYFLRVPRGYDGDQGARMIVFLHGSNMNGLQYLETIEDQRWCKNDILVCPNGEKGDDPFGANNFTFESAKLVAEVVKHVQGAYKATRIYLGGHSQGGFVTYSTIMRYPDLFDGAFPMAADCWSQNEPNLWEDKPDLLAKQKRIAIAVIHGRADPVVKFSQGEHAHGVFLAMGYPKLRFFAPEKLGHQFGLSPVPEALAWLDAMTGLDPEESLKAAKDWFKDEEWGWVHQSAAAALEQEGVEARNKSTAENAIKAVEKQAVAATAAMKETMASKDAKEWLPEWLEFRRQFGATEAAKDLVEAYEASRATERARGMALFQAAIALRRNKELDQSNQKLEQLLKEAPHSFHAWYAWSWLRNAE